MRVSLLPIELTRWDQAAPGDAICVSVWSDVRPLRGAAGLLDWRMCGRLSALVAAGKVTGAEGEQTLFPTAHPVALAPRPRARRGAAVGAFGQAVAGGHAPDALKAAKGLLVRRSSPWRYPRVTVSAPPWARPRP